jgi:hypothetical protein
VTLKATPAAGSTGYLYCGVLAASKISIHPCRTQSYQLTLTGDKSVSADFHLNVPPCVVPGVIGKPLGNAELNLAEVECLTGKVSYAFSSTVRKGRVISQSPRPHWQRIHGAVDLVVSKGKG